MPITLGSNIASLRGIRQLGRSTQSLAKVYQRLASGQRINTASDDAAGLAIASALRSDSRVYQQAVRNANDGISALTIAEGALQALSDIVLRQSELAEQAANGVYSFEQRQALHSEANALVKEYNRIVATTEFNGRALLSNGSQNIRLQVGYGLDGSIGVDLGTELSRTVGDGTFQDPSNFTVGNAPRVLNHGDFNSDGIQDIVAFNASGSSFSLLIGNGDGTFEAQSVVGVNAGNIRGTVADVNNDGLIDVITSSRNGDQVGVFLSNGDGSFAAEQNFATGDLVEVAAADFNNDGYIDLVSGDSGDRTISLLIGNGDGTFAARRTFAANNAQQVTTGDVNHDGNMDVAIAGLSDDNSLVLLGDGNGGFSTSVTISVPDTSNWVSLADIDNDGHLDLLSSINDPGGNYIYISKGIGDGSFEAGIELATGSGVRASEIVDLNGDGFLDIIAPNAADNNLEIYLNDGSGNFSLSDQIIPNDIFLADSFDANQDGAIDVIISDVNGDQVGVFLANTQEVSIQAALNLTSADNARTELENLRQSLQRLAKEQGAIGASQSRLSVAVANLTSSGENFQAAAARIEDADIAQESSALVRLSILQEAASAVLAQANVQPSLALRLLSA